MLDPFEQRRSQVLQSLDSQEVDKSRAGGVDARIQSLVQCMNQHADLYTTSSCSGRISVFAEPCAETKAAGKKGGEWVYATHDLADGREVLKCIRDRMTTGSKLIFRFEPFILAAECREMGIAQKVVAVARQAGFRESGVTATKARTIAGIRCSLRLEVPVAHEGRLLVDEAYLQKYLVDFGNEKMEANWARTARLHQLFMEQLLSQQERVALRHGHQALPKTQSIALRKASAGVPSHQSHISESAMQQLLQAGVPAQLLQQVQASQQEASSPDGTPPAGRGPGGGSIHSTKPEGQARTKQGRQRSCGKDAGVLERAGLLKARQEAILKRIRCLEGDQAQSTHQDDGSSASGGGLVWERVKPTLQGVEASSLNRWGHTSTLYDGRLVVFGGYGGRGAHSRSADVLVYDCTTHVLSSPSIQGTGPSARMGHSAVLFGHTLVIFGGRINPAQPLSDVWALDLLTYTWRCIACKGDAPAARFRHTAVGYTPQAQSASMFVHGGYNGQHTFSDTHILNTSDWTWQQVSTTGSAPPPCHSHAAALLQDHMFVFGGTQGYHHSCPALHVLDLKTHAWERVRLTQPATQASPMPCFSHSLTAAGGVLVLAGGCHTLGADHVYVFDPSLKQWSRHRVANSGGLVLCRHTATALPHHPPSILFLGGGLNCFGFGTTFSPPLLLNLTNLPKRCMAGKAGPPTLQASESTTHGHKAVETPAAANSSTYQASDVLLHGQSLDNTLRHGALPEEAIEVELTRQDMIISGGTRGVCPPGGPPDRGGANSAASSETTPGHFPREQSSQQPACKEYAKSGAAGKQGLAVVRLQAKAAKDALKSLGWLDQTYKAYSDASTALVCLPLTLGGSAMLQGAGFNSAVKLSLANGDAGGRSVLSGASDSAVSMAGSWLPTVTEGSMSRMTGSAAGAKGKKRKAGANQEAHLACLLALMQAGLGVVQPMEAHGSGRAEGGPAQRLKGAVTHLLQQQDLAQERLAELLLELPSRWEKLGDLALLPRTCMTSPEWGRLAQPLWEAVANALGVKRLAMQAPVADTGTRDSQAQLVLGASGWVQHKEGGVLYSLDVTKCMFSSGNTTERQRMGRLQCTGETILDLYAGIGYYTLPFLCKTGAAHVIACEWNPNALQALCSNLELNGVADRCHVLEGDCRLTAPKGIADRVCLGLLPSSQGGWQTALEALKPDLGGWLHLHHNVTDAAEAEWCQQTIAALQVMADHTLGRSWVCRLVHRERVKWYAPHVRHLVLDIHVQPSHLSA